ncbi:hypothetical protein VTL71DRAFT_5098 [Oculimacula yallundae]|uniref:Uncharacterized protein n=1 Tax=Oculimacula yallundae TaxID=86028 RepID=A0ABR4C2P4_9HELO
MKNKGSLIHRRFDLGHTFVWLVGWLAGLHWLRVLRYGSRTASIIGVVSSEENDFLYISAAGLDFFDSSLAAQGWDQGLMQVRCLVARKMVIVGISEILGFMAQDDNLDVELLKLRKK